MDGPEGNEMYARFTKVQETMEQSEFEISWQCLLTDLDSLEKLTPVKKRFVTYLRQQLGTRKTQWAYCHRVNARINVNMLIER